ncbi:Crp/Fnr family transcriptional regulator [Aureispira anguillae]|uniref:Crp/Fnr family transcriptional regulator n=1 Tax=Aureispira anguillae TaxID=2864201 RepID=A0A915YIM8_9BACT|nr:Crp/Fnr family transcriptional regulator [Aureispira anguillae]BDS13563.1 Crp/Fnr family transcriptional regulator [Aureispira anguillae]
MINQEILKHYNFKIIDYNKEEYVFEKGALPRYYFQIISGGIKMSYYNEKGNEFIQGIFGKDKSFGEPPLLANLTYPANAITLRKTSIIKIPKEDFERLLLENQEVHINLTKKLSKRLYFKAVMANGITSNSAEEAILSLFDYIKTNVHNKSAPFSCKIDLTRKNIAGLTGLTTETTIRKIKEMEANKRLKIIDSKVYY